MGKLTSSNDDLLDNKAEKAEVDNIKTLGIRPKDITDISKDAQMSTNGFWASWN